MALPQAPRGGGETRRVYFSYISTPGGAVWSAYLAGPSNWFECHTRPKCVPCLSALTGGELVCAICGGRRSGQVVGYVPLYRESDGRPVLVVVYEEQRDPIEKLELHTRVSVGRERGRGNRVWVTRALVPLPVFTSTLPERRAPADLTATLLAIWRMPELVDWWQRTQSRDKPAAGGYVIEVGARLSDAAAAAQLEGERRRAARAAGDTGPSLIGDVLTKVVPNGKHRKGDKPDG